MDEDNGVSAAPSSASNGNGHAGPPEAGTSRFETSRMQAPSPSMNGHAPTHEDHVTRIAKQHATKMQMANVEAAPVAHVAWSRALPLLQRAKALDSQRFNLFKSEKTLPYEVSETAGLLGRYIAETEQAVHVIQEIGDKGIDKVHSRRLLQLLNYHHVCTEAKKEVGIYDHSVSASILDFATRYKSTLGHYYRVSEKAERTSEASQNGNGNGHPRTR